jgi:ATP-dependent helicase/nuclease subunit A
VSAPVLTATPAQQRASETLDKHLAVTAGPGAGKTRVLVNRYLSILDSGAADMDRIVAITFTKKAANEMRERVRRGLDWRVEKYRGTLHEALWRDRKRRLEGAVITTIHGFCSRLLRENPLEALVDPQFTTLDDYTSSVMLDAAAQAAVTTLINEGDEAAARLVASYGRSTLVAQFIDVYKRLRNAGVAVSELEAATLANTAGADDYRERLASLTAVVERIAGVKVSGNSKDQVWRFLLAWDEVRPELEGEPTSASASPLLDALETLRRAGPDARAKDLKPLVEGLRSLIGTKDRTVIGALEGAFFDVLAREYAPHVFGTLKTLDALYTIEKRAAAALDYEDLQLRARDLLVNYPEVVRRVRARYRFFLVDEFQDTNGLQRDIIRAVTLGEPRANLFIVGDRKQSIYGFRGAEVEVFSQTIAELEREGGESIPLDVNFRSDPRLVGFFNEFFSRLMQPEPFDVREEIEALGFVAHEPISSPRLPNVDGPAVEVLLDLPRKAEGEKATEPAADDEGVRDREARRVAERLRMLVEGGERLVLERRDVEGKGELRPARYGDIAILLRAITDIKAYERPLRRLGIPYYVVAGKGFYDRPEVVDLLNLVEFLDNSTDELALAAVLRSPLFGVSDETLLALRADALRNGAGARTKSLGEALWRPDEVPLISDEQRAALARAVEILERLLALRNRVSTSQLLSESLKATDYEIVAAAAEDGAQRLSNLDKLIGLARGFERGGMRLLRDFVQFVREFRRLDAREAEALLRANDDAVAILTVHKSKGLEFPIVVIPDLQREFQRVGGNVMLDRHRGLAFKVPDGRGGLAKTGFYDTLAERRRVRERFECMRLLYVAATRAEDYLILSGASGRRRAEGRASGDRRALRDAGCWLEWVSSVLGASAAEGEIVVELGGARARLIGPDVAFDLPEGVREEDVGARSGVDAVEYAVPAPAPFEAVERVRRLLSDVPPAEEPSMRRFSATELQNFANCPRQFYYGRLLRIPSLEGRPSSRNAAEGASRGDALTPTFRGLVIHRFCETYIPGEDLRERLRRSLNEVRSARGDEFNDLIAATSEEAALDRLEPFARNYAESRMRLRVEERLRAGEWLPNGQHEYVRSEVPFALRTRHGFVAGAIDKVLLTRLPSGRLRAHIVDFKTGRVEAPGDDLRAGVEREAAQHRVQMQVYAQAVRKLVPDVTVVEATLHFLQPGPNVEFEFGGDVTGEVRAAEEIDRIMSRILVGAFDPASYEARPGSRCTRCRFQAFCPDAV